MPVEMGKIAIGNVLQAKYVGLDGWLFQILNELVDSPTLHSYEDQFGEILLSCRQQPLVGLIEDLVIFTSFNRGNEEDVALV
ncbi:hypothetical protein UB43_22820 [Pseudomonas sp. 21]|nr:hypothetical protein UB43_22820 [Pseudomonas sp. 21]